jgi:hypothetical protein
MQKEKNGNYPHHPEKCENSLYHIIYPRGDKSQLKVVEILAALDYELSEYSVASRKSFDNYYEAVDYAKSLAKENGLTFVSDDRQDYLD